MARAIRTLIAILALAACVPAVAQRAPEFMRESQFQHHLKVLGVDEVEDSPAHRVIEWYRTESTELKDTRRVVDYFQMDSAVEDVSGPLPLDVDEADAPLVVLVNRAGNRRRTKYNELVVTINVRYFQRLRKSYPNQVALVDRLQRNWRREQHLVPHASSYGTGIDLIRLADEAINEVAIRRSLDELLAEWEIEVDSLLFEMEASEVTGRQRRSDAYSQVGRGELSPEDAVEITTEPGLQRSQLLRLNERFFSLVLDELDEIPREAIRQAWFDNKYPFIWTRTGSTHSISRALDDKSLSDDDREVLTSLHGEIDRLRRTATARLDKLRKVITSETYVRNDAMQFALYLQDRSRQSVRGEEEREFREEGRRFLDEIEALEQRVAGITGSVAVGTVSQRTGIAQEGQREDPWYRLSFTPLITAETLNEVFNRIPYMSSDQGVVIRELHHAHLIEFGSASSAYRAKSDEGYLRRMEQRDGRSRFPRQVDPAIAPTRFDPTVQFRWRAAKPALERRFWVDAAVVFDQVQRTQWESEGRRIFRHGWFELSEFFRRTEPICDFFLIIDEAGLSESERSSLIPTLLEFEIQLDRIIEDRQVKGVRLTIEKTRLELEDPDRQRPATQAAVKRMGDHTSEARKRTNELGIRTRQQIANQLDEPARTTFIEASGRAMWPHLYDETPAQLTIRLLRATSALDDERGERMDAIESRYLAKRRTIIDRMEPKARDRFLGKIDMDELNAYFAARAAFREAARADPGVFMMLDSPWVADPRERFLLSIRTVRTIRALFAQEELQALPAGLRLALSLDARPLD